MGTLSNGFCYTNQLAAQEVVVKTKVNNGYFKLTYIEYYNINTNQSCLAITPSFKSNFTGELLSNNLYPKSGITNTSGITIDGTNLTAADGSAPVSPSGSSRRYRVKGSNSAYESVSALSEGTAFPWYTVPISHNNDGTKTVSARVNWDFIYQFYNEVGEIGNYTRYYDTNPFNIVLYTIPRSSTLIMPDTTVGIAVTGTLNSASTSFTHTISAAYGNYTETVNPSTLSFNPNRTQIYNSMASTSNHVTVTFTVNTYSGNTLIGTSTTTSKVYAEASAPTVVLNGVISNPQLALTGTEKIIYNYTNITLTASASATSPNATIASYAIGYGGSFQAGQTRTFNAVAASTFNAKAIDSRGNQGTTTKTYSYIDYKRPTIQITAVTKPDTSTGITNITVKGTWWYGNFGSAQNQLTISVRAYDIDAGTYTNWNSGVFGVTGNTFQWTRQLTLDYHKSYYIQCQVSDRLLTVAGADYFLQSVPIFYWTKDKIVFNKPIDAKENNEMISSKSINIKPISGYAFLNLYNTSNKRVGAIANVQGTTRLVQYPNNNNNAGEYFSLPGGDSTLSTDSYYYFLTTKAGQNLNLNGKIILGSNNFGNSLPSTGTAGQLFFLKV